MELLAGVFIVTERWRELTYRSRLTYNSDKLWPAQQALWSTFAIREREGSNEQRAISKERAPDLATV